MIEHQAYLLVRMEQLSEQARRANEDQSARLAYGLSQLARDLTRWTRALVRLPGRRRGAAAVPAETCEVRTIRAATMSEPASELRHAEACEVRTIRAAEASDHASQPRHAEACEARAIRAAAASEHASKLPHAA